MGLFDGFARHTPQGGITGVEGMHWVLWVTYYRMLKYYGPQQAFYWLILYLMVQETLIEMHIRLEVHKEHHRLMEEYEAKRKANGQPKLTWINDPRV